MGEETSSSTFPRAQELARRLLRRAKSQKVFFFFTESLAQEKTGQPINPTVYCDKF